MMDHDKRNPCDLCKQNCKNGFSAGDCAFDGFTTKYHCSEFKCFLNYEGSCMVGLYDRCGAWED